MFHPIARTNGHFVEYLIECLNCLLLKDYYHKPLYALHDVNMMFKYQILQNKCKFIHFNRIDIKRLRHDLSSKSSILFFHVNI